MNQTDKGTFAGFVLLSSPKWDLEKLKADLHKDWNIVVPVMEESKEEEERGILVFEIGDYMVAVSLMPAPVPAAEAEYYAQSNYFWKGAVDAAKEHQAHLIVAVFGEKSNDLYAIGRLFVKICASCLKQENALGIYTNGTVLEPEMYCAVAGDMNESEENYPIMDWVFIGLYQNDQGLNGYTNGMKVFGKDEIEVIGSTATPAELHEFLFDTVSYVLYDDVLLQDGETIGFTEDEKLSITRSEGAVVEGESLKIAYMTAELPDS